MKSDRFDTDSTPTHGVDSSSTTLTQQTYEHTHKCTYHKSTVCRSERQRVSKRQAIKQRAKRPFVKKNTRKFDAKIHCSVTATDTYKRRSNRKKSTHF